MRVVAEVARVRMYCEQGNGAGAGGTWAIRPRRRGAGEAERGWASEVRASVWRGTQCSAVADAACVGVYREGKFGAGAGGVPVTELGGSGVGTVRMAGDPGARVGRSPRRWLSPATATGGTGGWSVVWCGPGASDGVLGSHGDAGGALSRRPWHYLDPAGGTAEM